MERIRETLSLPKVEIEEIVLLQKKVLSEAPVEEISTGTVFHLERVIERLPDEDFLLVDLGCGIGNKTVVLARMALDAGKRGQIIAADINRAAIDLLSQRAIKEGLPIQGRHIVPAKQKRMFCFPKLYH